jgi:hypothetical protein
MSTSISDHALPVPSPNPPLRNKGYTPLFLLLIGLGSPSPWITCLVYLQPSMVMTVSSWSLINSLRWKILTPYKKSIIVEATAKLFFEHVWVHFGLPQTIILDHDSKVLEYILVQSVVIDGHQAHQINFLPPPN